MKLDSSKPGALSFKVLEAGQEEIRPPLTPATEVDLQKSCAILVQSTGYSKSFRDAVNSTHQRAHARQNGTVPIRSHNRTPSKAGTRTPVGRVGKSHRRSGSSARYEKAPTSTSKYVPPRRPAPERAVPVTRHGRKVAKEEETGGPEDDQVVKAPKLKKVEEEQVAPVDRKSSEKERKSTDGSGSGEEAEKNRKGVKKLVVNMHHAVTGYLRPHDLVTSPAPPTTEVQISPTATRNDRTSTEASPTVKNAKPAVESLKIKASTRKDGTTYVEAMPEFFHATKTSSEDEKNTDMKRSVSKRLGHVVKEYVRPPHVDRFTPERLTTSTSKEELKKSEQKKHRVTKAMKEYVKPLPLDISEINEIEEALSPVKSEKTPKSAGIPAEKPPKREKSPIEHPAPNKELPKPPTEPVTKPKLPGANGHHNPFRMLHDYVKPSMVVEPTPPVIQTSPTQAPSLPPILPSERRPLAPQTLQPVAPYVPPKIRPRGKTLPSSEDPPPIEFAPSPSIRAGPVFGGGYPAKNYESKDKENKGPVSPGFFGRNPGGSGFRIHFSHFLHKQRSDGYDQID
ncbi:hypothetical protein ABW20_dc0107514 [Dactylellina cionopaga]|nr:hypothetical protein ABW20_dc0107514 [Dactylellina cionopaga]